MVKRGSWVQIHKIVLEPEDRAPQVPEDTKKVPLEMWVKGYLLENAYIGDFAAVRTLTGRVEKGTVVEENPTFTHNYGAFVPEILQIGRMVKSIMFGDDHDE